MTLFEKMRSYQVDQLMKDPDAPIPENVRVINDGDIDRLRNVQTAEELQDVHNHFVLYYAQDLPAMHAAWRTKERERKKEAKRVARLVLGTRFTSIILGPGGKLFYSSTLSDSCYFPNIYV